MCADKTVSTYIALSSTVALRVLSRSEAPPHSLPLTTIYMSGPSSLRMPERLLGCNAR